MTARPRVLIAGGCGFIGTNAAHWFQSRGWRVCVFDNLSRGGTKENLEWLKRKGPLDFRLGDVRDSRAVSRWVSGRSEGTRLAIHLAAQVAVTTSVLDPKTDFEVNALGSIHLLEALRRLKRKPFTVFASTNKVYGGMEDVRVRRRNARYAYAGRPHGIPETQPLDFHSPYGCSKGSADQYVRDYHRIYGLPTVVLRQSCIYGPHQHGTEDQGWVAHFMKEALAGRGIMLYGDGRQVRDVLYVEDLIEAVYETYRRRAACGGRVYNIGGGPGNTLSLLELLDWIAIRLGRRVQVSRHAWRPGDQRVYVSDIRKARKELGWAPRTPVDAGLRRLWDWLS